MATAIPSYCMTCFLLPKKLCQEIERILNGFWWSSSSSGTGVIRWMSWDKLSDSKNKGGLGFRNLHGYNLAMLGKHVWNFVHKPHSLVSRVFKAKYYPNSHILNASSNGGASFIWSGIFKAKEELKKGFKWILGNGKDISVSSDPWLRGKEDFMIDNGDDFDVNMKVNQLFRHNSAEWDREKIYDMFNERDANAILNMRIPCLNTPDRIAWMHSTDGHYTAKSGYNWWQDSNRQQVSNENSMGWKRIWKLHVPSKVKFFLWRFCKNNIPVVRF